MQPYRTTDAALCLTPWSATTHTCLDPPRETAEAKRRGPFFELVVSTLIACAFVGGVGFGSLSLNELGRSGHIEIAPNALARHPKRPANAAKKAEPAAQGGLPLPASTLKPVRPFLGGVHDPKKLLAWARELETIGLDVTVSEVPLSKVLSDTPHQEVWPTQSRPIHGYGGVEAFELRGIPASSPLRVLGIADGDQLLGIDGYRFDNDSFYSIDMLAIQKRGFAVVELARGEHHVVLGIRWDPKKLL